MYQTNGKAFKMMAELHKTKALYKVALTIAVWTIFLSSMRLGDALKISKGTAKPGVNPFSLETSGDEIPSNYRLADDEEFVRSVADNEDRSPILETTKSLDETIDEFYEDINNIELVDQIDKESQSEYINRVLNNDMFHEDKKEINEKDDAYVKYIHDEQIDSDGFVRKIRYRDTFIDHMLAENNAKKSKRDITNVEIKTDKYKVVAGDTVLNINSEISDVIKSDLGSFDNKKQRDRNRESYVDDIVIHPSKFVTDVEDNKNKTRSNRDGLKRNVKTFDDAFSRSRRDEGDVSNITYAKAEFISKFLGIIFKNVSGDNLTGLEETKKYTNRKVLTPGEQRLYGRLYEKQPLWCRLPENASFIMWFMNGEEVKEVVGELEHVALPEGFPRLWIISRMERQHTGRWVCSGRLPGGRLIRSEPIILTLGDPPPPYLEVFGKRLDASNVFLPVKENTRLMLTCRFEGDPYADLDWEPVRELEAEQPLRKNGEVTSMAIVLVKRIHHNTTISCKAFHGNLKEPIIASILLDVQYEPRFTISRIPGFGFPLTEGLSVTLRCDIDSNPPVGPKWVMTDAAKKDPPKLVESTDGVLYFPSISREDSGWYRCMTSQSHVSDGISSLGYFLNVRYEITESPAVQTNTGWHLEKSLESEEVECLLGTMKCWSSRSRDSRTPVGLMYLEEGGDERCRGIDVDEVHVMQVIKDSQKKDEVLVTPHNATVSTQDGAPTVLGAMYCSFPAPSRVLWLAAGRALPLSTQLGDIQTSNATENGSDCWSCSLHISRTHARHAGEYALLVRTPSGALGEAVFALRVLAPASRLGDLAADSHALHTHQASTTATILGLAIAAFLQNR